MLSGVFRALSGWTQEELAEKEGRSQSYTAQKLLFGRFLGFIASGNNLPNPPRNLTERRLRQSGVKTKNYLVTLLKAVSAVFDVWNHWFQSSKTALVALGGRS